MTAANLADDTRTEPVAKVPGLYTCSFPDHWNYINPCGGALLTVALRAMKREVDAGGDGLQLLSATTVFCQPVAAGQLTIEVVTLRRGDNAAQLRASVRALAAPGPGLDVIATFVRERPGPDAHGVGMPAAPSAQEAFSAAERRFEREKVRFPFFQQLDIALAIGEPMWKKGWSKGPAHTGYWYRYRAPQRDDRDRFDALALPPLADTMPSALTRLLGPDHERYFMPSLDLTVHFVAPTTSEAILVETFVERTRAGYAVGSANLWDEGGQLVARASQTMTLRSSRLQPRSTS
jgi:acyl-CoA thioesterase